MGRRVAVPDHIRHALEKLLGDGVERVVVIENSLFARMHFRIQATTRKRRIYLVGSAERFFGDPSLMLHEYCHVLKQWEPGHLTVGRYLAEWWRRGYWDNRFEIEAREFASDNLYRFRALLRQANQPSSASR
jgi:hypothetical protein